MQTDLDTLKDAIKITDLARSLGLQIRGRQARCFNTGGHKNQDKHFSLGLNIDTNRFKCFACGVQGSVIDLYKEVKGVSVSEAINDLTKMAGLQGNIKPPVKQEKTGLGQPTSRIKTKQKQARTSPSQQAGSKPAPEGIYEVLQGYCGELDSQSLAYLTGATRGLTRETIARFQLFSIKDYQATNKFMQEKFSLEQLQQAGLVSEAGNLIFYQHKVIIPFIEGGRIIFLQGRRTDNQHPKYMHLKRSVPLFNAETLKILATGERVYICEGVFDAMILEQNGFKATAILGVNNFKPEMAELFSGLDIVLCLDNDEQGARATQDLAGVFLLQGQSVKRKLLPDGVKDITEWYIK